MVLTVLLLLALIWQFYLGYSRGLVKQTYLVLAVGLAFEVAKVNYLNLAKTLTLWVPYTQAVEEKTLTYFPEVSIFEMDKVFYAGVAFLSFFIGTYLALRLLALFLHLFPLDKLDKPILNSISGGLSVLVSLVFWSATAYLLATLPFDGVQHFLTNQPFIRVLIELPILSDLFHQLWVVTGA